MDTDVITSLAKRRWRNVATECHQSSWGWYIASLIDTEKDTVILAAHEETAYRARLNLGRLVAKAVENADSPFMQDVIDVLTEWRELPYPPDDTLTCNAVRRIIAMVVDHLNEGDDDGEANNSAEA